MNCILLYEKDPGGLVGERLGKSLEDVRRKYPSHSSDVARWKVESRDSLKTIFSARPPDEADLFARNLVKKVQRQIQAFHATAEKFPQNAPTLAIVADVQGGQIGRSVFIADSAAAQTVKYGPQILKKLRHWAETVDQIGITEARKIPGLRDHALNGAWNGHHSSWLTVHYRVVYFVRSDGAVEIAAVNAHNY